MKLKDVEVGGRYTAKVSGRVVTVRVTGIEEHPPTSWSVRSRSRTVIHAISEATGRRITFRSAQRLRSRVG